MNTNTQLNSRFSNTLTKVKTNEGLYIYRRRLNRKSVMDKFRRLRPASINDVYHG